MTNKSYKKFYELDRTYDYSKEGSKEKRKFVKHRAHKRLRRQLNIYNICECAAK